MPEEEPQHWPTERMIEKGHGNYATKEDLMEVEDESVLIDIAHLCEMEEFAPEECIPCLAHVMVLEMREERESEVEDRDTPKLDELMSTPSPFRETQDLPVVERFRNQVAVLSDLVEEMLGGPPIPPKNVTLEELACLVVGAQRWLKIIDAQGIELSPSQEKIRQEIQRVIEKVNR